LWRVTENELIEIPRVGVGFRAPIADWVLSKPDAIDCVEVTAEHFFDSGADCLRELTQSFPIYVHGLGLSLGTPEPLDSATLRRFRRVAEIADPDWISEHIAFTKSGDVELGHLNPVPCTARTLQTLVDHAREVMDLCQKPLILENITTFLPLPGEMSETDFINQLCDTAGVGLLLDVTNLLINSRNHKFDPVKWLRELNPNHIVQLHIVGYSVSDGVWLDHHAASVQDDLLELMQEVVAYAPVQAIILERDAHFPPVTELAAELIRLEDACESARLR
jgi:uncharacterized protein